MVLSVWIGLNAFDAALTWIGIDRGANELNPHLGAIAAVLGVEAMLVLKVAVAATVGGLLWKHNAFRVFRGINIAMWAVVVHNALVVAFFL